MKEKRYNSNKAITLIALVVIIIVLLILAGVTINMLFGENGIITQSQMSAFVSEMTSVKEKVNLRNQAVELAEHNGEILQLFSSKVTADELNNFPDTLKQEIMYFRDGAPSDKEPSEYDVSEFNINIDGIWKIDSKTDETSDLSDDTYIYDEISDIVFKIKQTKINGKIYHSYEALSTGGGTSSDINTGKDTIITDEFSSFETGYYEPDYQGFDSTDTYVVYYTSNILEGNENVDAILVPIKEYISEGKKRSINRDGIEYIAYDYNNKVWANAVTIANGVESWWVWAPRYAYNTTISNNNFSILFLTTDNKVIVINDDETQSMEELSQFSGYVQHPGFTITDESGEDSVTTELKGIWMSKFNASETESSNTTESSDDLCYKPDMTGYDDNNTYMVYYSEDFTETYLMILSEYNSKNQPRTITQNGKEFTLYEYSSKIWANIITVANGVESWWVWVPRYAYSTDIATGYFSIIFVDTSDNPIDKEKYGNSLPENYIVHPGFTITDESSEDSVTTELKGIWMSKFNASETESSDTTESSENLCYKPDMTGYDDNNTYMVYYSEDFSKTYVMKLSEYNSKGEPRTIKVIENADGSGTIGDNGNTYILYDYASKRWANIITNANNIQSWWVWAPRYAYSTDIATGYFSIIFVDTDNTPYNKELYGNSLPDNYIVHPGFDITGNEEEGANTTKLKGLWMSKFNATNVADPTN